MGLIIRLLVSIILVGFARAQSKHMIKGKKEFYIIIINASWVLNSDFSKKYLGYRSDYSSS